MTEVTHDVFSTATEEKLIELSQRLSLVSTALSYILNDDAGLNVVEIDTNTCFGIAKTIDGVKDDLNKLI